MPGRSPHEVVLSEDERAELQHRAACYTRPHREVQRARLVLLAAEGRTNTEIGERLGMSREAVGRWRRRFCERRLDGRLRRSAMDLLISKHREGFPVGYTPVTVANEDGDFTGV